MYARVHTMRRDRVKRRNVRACEGMRDASVARAMRGDVCAHACTSARVRAWVRATRARDVHDDYSDIVVIVEGTIGRQ